MPLRANKIEDEQPVLGRFERFRNSIKFKQDGGGAHTQNDRPGGGMSPGKVCASNKDQNKNGVPTTTTTTSNNCVIDTNPPWNLSRTPFVHGPDQILPSTTLRTSEANGAVRIFDHGDLGVGRREPISVPSLLKCAAEKNPNHTALAVKRDGVWRKWTYNQYHQDVRTVAKAFIALGLERFHSVCILGFNTPEWFQADLGAIFAGGFAAGIYTTNSPEACAYCAIDSKCEIFVVEDEKQLAKVLEIRHKLPHLKAIVQYTGEPSHDGVISWSKLLLLGDNQPDTLLEERLSKIAINQCCTLIYTSGTTGNPKGVMLSHDNLTWTAYTNSRWCGFREVQEKLISYLPLSHIAAQIGDIYCPLIGSGCVYFADHNALKGSLIETMKEVGPTKFFAVPRVWEKMYEKMQDAARDSKGVKKSVANWAKRKGLDHNMRKMRGEKSGKCGFWLANKMVLSRIRRALGVSKCDLHLSGAAPIAKEILRFFMSLNIVVTEVYGMSECCGPHCVAIESAFRLGSCGKTLPGCLTKIEKPDDQGNGEILMAGRHVAMGYLNQMGKTRLTFDPKGWLHSEDVGHVDKDGFIFITGRIKELLITAGGENVAPVPIEDRVKHELPIVSSCLVLGDRLKFLSILLTLKTEVDHETQEPLDVLQPHAKTWIQEQGRCQVNTVHEVLMELHMNNNKRLRHAIQKGINMSNMKAPSRAQRIQKWQVLPKDFSIAGGELGPTLKLRRQVVYKKYADIIYNLYKLNSL